MNKRIHFISEIISKLNDLKLVPLNRTFPRWYTIQISLHIYFEDLLEIIVDTISFAFFAKYLALLGVVFASSRHNDGPHRTREGMMIHLSFMCQSFDSSFLIYWSSMISLVVYDDYHDSWRVKRKYFPLIESQPRLAFFGDFFYNSWRNMLGLLISYCISSGLFVGGPDVKSWYMMCYITPNNNISRSYFWKLIWGLIVNLPNNTHIRIWALTTATSRVGVAFKAHFHLL